MRKLLTATAIIAASLTLSADSNAATFVDVVTRPHKGAWQWQCAVVTTHHDGIIHDEMFYGGWRGSFATRAKAESVATNNIARCLPVLPIEARAIDWIYSQVCRIGKPMEGARGALARAVVRVNEKQITPVGLAAWCADMAENY
jgi:hypothetical protein